MSITENILFSVRRNSVAECCPKGRAEWVTDQRAEEPYGLLLYREKTYS